MKHFENLQNWLLHTPNGRYILANERVFYHNFVHNVFGYYALQIGFPQINLLQNNKIQQRYILGYDIKCDLHFLPFSSNSVDLIICPHILEFSDNYPRLLEEFYRILIPDGKLIITCFSNNLFSHIIKKPEELAAGNFIKLNTLKQQLNSLNFRIAGGKFFCYRPLLSNRNIFSKLGWLEKVGDRWFPTSANIFGLTAIKDKFSLTPLQTTPPTYAPKFEPNLGISGYKNTINL
ncbi:MAG: class I SAM-dependent methyltransferase [Burkholderiales bacterium]|nr:class I SAM-dependent methyltransferase [Burkholderiales bacterium]